MEPIDSQLMRFTIRLQVLDLVVTELIRTQPGLDGLFERLAQRVKDLDSMLAPELRQELQLLQSRVRRD